MDLFFGWKQHTKVTYFAFVYYFLSTGILHLIIDAPIFNLIFSISAISFVTCTYRTRLWKKICVVLFLYCYMAVVELIVGNITGYAKTDMIGEGSYQNVAGLIIMKLLFFLGTLIFYNIKSMKLNSNLSIPIWSASCLIPIISVIIAFTLFFNEEIHTIQLTIALVLLVIANILIFYLYDLLAQFYMKRVDAEVLNKERQYYFHQCELMNQMQENTASYRHDLKNHMMVLAGLAEESKITEIQDYIEKNIASLPTTKVYSKTRNIYLDSIINFKLSEAEQLGTKLQYRVEAASDQVIDPRDLTIILGNLLDNAITAVAVELYIGTDPTKKDTDGDGLTDYDELFETFTDPTLYDTDSNGINDGQEDFDNDNLNNIEEIENGTDCYNDDTDADGLIDGDEVKIYHSNPLKADTDGDTLVDGDDVALGFDPTLPDTDFNGILDCDEKTKQTLTLYVDDDTNPIESVTVSFKGTGNINKNTSITDIKGKDVLCSNVVGLVGNPYDINSTSQFNEAELSFKIRKKYLGATVFDDLAILWYNKDEQTFELIDCTLDSANSVIKATLPHFSKYMIVNRKEWAEAWATSLDYSKYDSYDIVYAIDCSGSMEDLDPEPNESGTASKRHMAANNLIGVMEEDDEAAVIGFNYTTSLLCDFTSDQSDLRSVLYNLYQEGSTNFNPVLSESISKLTTRTETSEETVGKMIILISDGGMLDDLDEPLNEDLLAEAKREGIKIYTIGVGVDVDEEILHKIAKATGGEYYYASTNDEISDLYNEIGVARAKEIDMADFDEDGLPDIFEIVGMQLQDGTVIRTDPSKSDTDGDGLLDGEEITIYYNESTGTVNFTMTSDPNLKDSDGDGKSDIDDTLPLLYDISSMVIFQSERSETNDEDGKFAEDLECGKLSKSDLYNMSIFLGDQASNYDESIIINGEEYLFSSMKDLFWLLTSSNDDMRDVAYDMINHFRYGNGENYSNDILTEYAKNHESTQRYLTNSRRMILDEIKALNGNLSYLESADMDSPFIKSLRGVGNPHYDRVEDLFNGLTICIDDTWGNQIEIVNYEFDGKNYKGTIRYKIYDHFGLDTDDVNAFKRIPVLEKNWVKYEWIPGFASWFVLQRYENCEEKYKPYVTYITIEEDFEGSID